MSLRMRASTLRVSHAEITGFFYICIRYVNCKMKNVLPDLYSLILFNICLKIIYFDLKSTKNVSRACYENVEYPITLTIRVFFMKTSLHFLHEFY